MTISDHSQSSHPAWHFLLPSARDIIFLFLFCSLLVGTLSSRPLADPDIGWHIRTGEQILLTHSLPRTDSYSSLMQGQPWYAWEWLYDLLLGILHHFCGLNGVVWLCAALVASTFTLLLSQLLIRGTNLFLAVALMLLAEGAASVHLYARPHIASWLLALLWFIALDRWEQGTAPSWLPWFFPVSMLFWVNLHAGWIFGGALLALYVLASALESWRAGDPFAALEAAQRARSMFFWGFIAFLVTFLNPYGWRLHAHIYRYLGDRYLMNRIAEFGSPNFHLWPQRCFAITLILALIALAGHLRPIRLSHLLVILLTIYSGLLSTRNLPTSAMLLVLILGPILSGILASLSTSPGAWLWLRTRLARFVDYSARMAEQELQLRGHLWPVVATIAVLALCLQAGRLGSRQLIRAHFDPKSVPVAAVDFLENHPAADPIFSTDSWGGYVIYRLYPRRLVVVDDRHDLYGSDRVRQILILMQGEPSWRSVLDKLHPDTVLLPPGSVLASLLRELPQQWQIAYEDRVAVVFEKRVR